MPAKKIFNKKKYNKKNAFVIFFFLLIFIIFINFYLFYETKNYIVVTAEENSFYFTPKDRGGEKVKNLNKKSLSLKSEKEFKKVFNQPNDIYFSIQFYTDNTFDSVSKYLEKLNYDDESIYNLKDFFIMVLNTEIGSDYFLLYKSFRTRELAKKYCNSFLNKLDKCLIVDTSKF